jgi:hypothetical protein
MSVLQLVFSQLTTIKTLERIGGTIEKQIGFWSHNLHFSDILRPKQIQRLLRFDFYNLLF